MSTTPPADWDALRLRSAALGDALSTVLDALTIREDVTAATHRRVIEANRRTVLLLLDDADVQGAAELSHNAAKLRRQVEASTQLVDVDLAKQAAKAEADTFSIDGYLTTEEAAERLGINELTLSVVAAHRQIAPAFAGTLWAEDDIENLAAELAEQVEDAEALAEHQRAHAEMDAGFAAADEADAIEISAVEERKADAEAQAEADEHDTELPEPYPGASYRERAPRRGEACSCGRAATTVYLMDGRQVPYCGSQHQAAQADTEMPGTDVTRTVEAPVYRYLVQPHGHPEVYRGAIRGEAVGAIVAWAILHDARPLRDEVGVWATRIETGGVKVGDPIEARNVTNLARVALAEAYQAKLDTELPGRDVTRVHDSHAVGDDQRFAGGVVGDPRFLRDKTPADLVAAWEYDANLAQSEDPNGAHETRGFARDLKEALTRVRIVPADAIVLERPTEEAVNALELHIDLTEEFIAAHAVNEDGGHEVLAHHICGSCSEIGADVYTPAQARTRAALFALAADDAESNANAADSAQADTDANEDARRIQ